MNKASVWYPFRTLGKKLLLTCASIVVAISAFAQDKEVDININTDKGGGFWGSPVVWVIGAAVFILLLVALIRGSGSKSDA